MKEGKFGKLFQHEFFVYTVQIHRTNGFLFFYRLAQLAGAQPLKAIIAKHIRRVRLSHGLLSHSVLVYRCSPNSVELSSIFVFV